MSPNHFFEYSKHFVRQRRTKTKAQPSEKTPSKVARETWRGDKNEPNLKVSHFLFGSTQTKNICFFTSFRLVDINTDERWAKIFLETHGKSSWSSSAGSVTKLRETRKEQ